MTQLTGAALFARQLRRERWLMSADKDRDIENVEIAAALGVDASTVGRWFDGESVPRDATLERLAAFFGVTPGWMRYAMEPREAPKRAEPLPAVRQYGEVKRMPEPEEEKPAAKKAATKKRA